MTGRRRQDCSCGALVGLFFDQATVESYSAGTSYTEHHYARAANRRCIYFVNSLEVTGDKLERFLMNTASTRGEAIDAR